MSTTDQAEAVHEIAAFMTNLCGLDIAATQTGDLNIETVGAVATYVDDEGNVNSHIACDLSGAAILAAALTQIPKGAVEDVIQTGVLPDNLRENIYEVLNIAVNLLPAHATHRLVLQEVVYGAEATERAATLGQSLCADLDVARYGAAKLFLSHQ